MDQVEINRRGFAGLVFVELVRRGVVGLVVGLVVFGLIGGASIGCAPVAQGPSVNQQREALNLIDQGTLALRAGEFEQAEAAFQTAWEIAKLPAALDGLGCVAFMRGDVVRAEKYFVEAYQMDPDYIEALGNLALLYESQGLTNEAANLYERAIQENPGNPKLRNNYAAFLKDASKQQRDRGVEQSKVRRAKSELYKANALVKHPLIQDNISKVEK